MYKRFGSPKLKARRTRLVLDGLWIHSGVEKLRIKRVGNNHMYIYIYTCIYIDTMRYDTM